MGEKITKDSDRWFEEIEVGETYAVEDARTITEADIVNFAGVTGDFHPHHMSKTFAASESNFQERVAHGNLVFTITEGLVNESNPKALSYGHDGLRYIRPVTIGDTISATRTVDEKEDHDETFGRIVYKYETENQDGETVLVNYHSMLVRKRDSEAGTV